MDTRADLNQTAFLASEDHIWQPSPLAGVDRVLLDRVGGEVAVATSLVRYAQGASFNPHKHELGEEFVVLDGVFSDEHGDYPVGSYLRNPPGTGHKPHSNEGCVIFVKLRQFADEDLVPVKKHIPLSVEGTASEVLYEYGDEVVSWVHVPAGERFAFPATYHVRELLVLVGSCTWQQETTHTLNAWSWVRMKAGEPLRINATTDCILFSKTRPVYRPADV